MKLKSLMATSLALTGAVVLAACNSQGNSKEVVFLTTAGDDLMNILNQAKEKFEAENAEWTVTITNGYSYDTLRTKVNQDLAGNAQPSLAFCYPDHVAGYLKSRKVLDLSKFIEDKELGFTKEENDDFVASYLTEGTSYSQEGTYSFPFVRSTEVLYYNKDVLDAEGIEVPKTWAELWTACNKLKNAYPKSTPLGYDSEANWFITYMEQYAKENGGKYYTDGSKNGTEKVIFNNDVAKAFLKELNENNKKGLFTTKEILGGYTSSLFTQYKVDEKPENNTKEAYTGSFFSIGSTGGASKQEGKNFTAEVASIPGITAANPLTISQGPSLVMFDQNQDDRAEATWKFVKTLLSKEIQASYALASGYNPVRKSVYEMNAVVTQLAKDNLVSKTMKLGQTLANSNVFYSSDTFVGSSACRDQVGALLKDAVVAQYTVDGLAKLFEAAEEEAKYATK